MLPFYEVRRWLAFPFRGNVKRSVHELKVNSTTSKDEQDAAKKCCPNFVLRHKVVALFIFSVLKNRPSHGGVRFDSTKPSAFRRGLLFGQPSHSPMSSADAVRTSTFSKLRIAIFGSSYLFFIRFPSVFIRTGLRRNIPLRCRHSSGSPQEVL